MTHMLIDEPLTPVPTEHGDGYVTTGVNHRGQRRLVLVGPGDDRTDWHLTRDQAFELLVELANGITALDAAIGGPR